MIENEELGLKVAADSTEKFYAELKDKLENSIISMKADMELLPYELEKAEKVLELVNSKIKKE